MAAKKNSKISDYFKKITSPQKDGKRKVSHIVQTGSTVLNSVTNLFHNQKRSCELSPDPKKVKHDENYIDIDCCVKKEIKENDVSHLDKYETELQNRNGDLDNLSDFNLPVNHQTTPEKCRPCTIVKTPSSIKPSVSGGTGKKTPQSSKKVSPKKLFEKSPRSLGEFNVEVLEKFVKVSPSTSNKIIRITHSSAKSHNTLVSESIIRSTQPQNNNESISFKTPKKLLIENMENTISSQQITNNIEKLDLRDNSMDNLNTTEFILNEEFNNAFDSFLNDEFNDVMIMEFNKLTFDEPQYCKILGKKETSGKIILSLQSLKNGDLGTCTVKGFWMDNHFNVKDKIYLTAKKDSSNEWVVDNESGWVVYEPDLLISCTSVVNSIFCKRRSVLSERYRGFEPTNRIMVVGVLVHLLLQRVLKDKLNKTEEIENIAKNLIKSEDTVKRLYESNLSLPDIESELLTFVPKIAEFVKEYVVNPKLKNSSKAENWNGKISGIDDIEENLWCPELGIKGKIDVSIKTESKKLMPLEIKTGRATVSLEHRGQVMLYIMMMNKFGYNVSSGLLLYLREGVLKEIKTTPQEKRDVIILRNELAYYLTRKVTNTDNKLKPPELPEPINHHSACAKCPYNVICTSYLKFENYNLSENKKLKEVQKDVTAHLSENHLNYFIHWSTLLSIEEESATGHKNLHEIYTIEPTKREQRGRCIINLKVVAVEEESNNLFEHKFQKDSNNMISLVTYGIAESNYVVVSTDTRTAIAAGFVTEVASSTISVSLDRNLNIKYKNKLFHLDTYDSNITQSFNLTSLALLMGNTPRAAELRKLIIDKTPPTFATKLPSVVAKKGAPILRRLNQVQQKAVLKALTAKDFLLIKGMPGTGKTATVVALVQLLVELNKTVLITSHTHSAVDNICIRLQKYGIDFLRLGSESKIDQNLKSKSESNLTKGCTSPEQLEKVYNSFKVIAVTCLGSNHPLLSKRSVDVCIVDESTQVLQTSIIKPLYAAKTFILIGDPDQLAPVVRNREALNNGMAESLFERLHNENGIFSLHLNYRMNKTITDLANAFTYEGQLRAANNTVANATLKIPKLELIKSEYQKRHWLLKALDTALEKSVQIIDTGPVWQLNQNVKWLLKSAELIRENSEMQSFINVYEVAIVATLVKALLQGGVPSSDIGVIATYRAQVDQISALLNEMEVDVSTVDQFQGRDKNVVIYSCAKSKDMSKTTSDNQKFELLEDKRRLTVAITRAKHKLIIVGDLSTLRNYSTFSSILSAVNRENIVEFDGEWDILNNF